MNPKTFDALYRRLLALGKMSHMRLQKAGPYIGPRGGLWKDPEHTQHWGGPPAAGAARNTPEAWGLEPYTRDELLRFTAHGLRPGWSIVTRAMGSRSPVHHDVVSGYIDQGRHKPATPIRRSIVPTAWLEEWKRATAKDPVAYDAKRLAVPVKRYRRAVIRTGTGVADRLERMRPMMQRVNRDRVRAINHHFSVQSVANYLDFADRGEGQALAEKIVAHGGPVWLSRDLDLDEMAERGARAYLRHHVTEYEDHLGDARASGLHRDDYYGDDRRDSMRSVDEWLARKRAKP